MGGSLLTIFHYRTARSIYHCLYRIHLCRLSFLYDQDTLGRRRLAGSLETLSGLVKILKHSSIPSLQVIVESKVIPFFVIFAIAVSSFPIWGEG